MVNAFVLYLHIINICSEFGCNLILVESLFICLVKYYLAQIFTIKKGLLRRAKTATKAQTTTAKGPFDL